VIARIGVALAFAAAAAVLSFRPVYEPDLGWHLAHGRENLAGRLVRTNVFSFTYPDYRQHFTSWLFDTGAYAAWRAGGDPGVQTLQAAILAATFWLVYLACRVRSALLPTIAVMILGFLVIEPRAIPRPHLISFLGLAAVSWLIERARAGQSAAPLVWCVPLAAIWGNFHGEALLGVCFLGLFAVAELARPSAFERRTAARAVAFAVLSATALLLNPYGLGLIKYLYENISLPHLLDISELRPAYLPTYRAFFVYLGLALVLLLSQPRRLTLWEVLATSIAAALGWRYLRLTPLLVLVTAPMLAARLTAFTARGIDGRALVITAAAAVLVLFRLPFAALVPSFSPDALHPETYFSPRAISFARAERLEGPFFNSNNLGGWLALTLYPQARIFQDSRMQAYPREQIERILDASHSQPAWNALVTDVDWAVLSLPRPNQLSGAGRFPRPAWVTVFWDDAVEIVVRRESRYAPLAASREYTVVVPAAEVAVLATQLASPERDRIRTEARRQRSDNPDGFLAAAVLCLLDDVPACADVDRLAKKRPDLEHEVALVRLLRTSPTDRR
jgi:hypothetical protein